MGFIFDWMSLFFIRVVCLISFFIIIYSTYYIEGDLNNTRFIFILFSFIISIIFLIISPNLISLILGWDGLGLRSYALVIFYQNERSANSGIITVLSNRLGDVGILLAVGWIVYKGSWNFLFFNNLDILICVIIVIRAFTKRAQIPFSAWLPEAMAAPTPVSSLVHSSTLVTAGVFLVIRFRELVSINNLNYLCLYFGLMTTIMSGLVAVFENDMKKVVALSTLRQLGIIFISIGLDQSILAFFHLIIHALFKSTLFMCTGFFIHNSNGSQDIRLRGLINFSSPVLGVIFSCTNISLCGFPFLSGFYSKDIIIEKFFREFYGFVIFFLGLLSIGLTLLYSLRFLFNSCNNKSKTRVVLISSDLGKAIFFSVVFLFTFSIIRGFFFGWLLIVKGGVFSLLKREKFYIFIVFYFFVFLIIILLSLSLFLSSKINMFLTSMFFIPFIRKYSFSFFFINFSSILLKSVDKGWYETRGPRGLSLLLSKNRFIIQKSQVFFLIGYFLFSLVIFMLFIIMWCLRSSKGVSLKLKKCNFYLKQ